MANLIRRENRNAARGGNEWDPFRMMDALLRWDPFRSPESGWGTGVADFRPRLDVKESKDGYLVHVDVPGMAEKDVDITMTGNTLTISGQREEEHREEGDQFHVTERSYGRFARTLSLPDGADAENVRAELKNGVLTVHIPKRPEVQPKRITVGRGSETSAKS